MNSGAGRVSRGAGQRRDGVGPESRHGGSLQLMNSLKGCLLVAAVGPELWPGNLICIVILLRRLLIELVLTLGHPS